MEYSKIEAKELLNNVWGFFGKNPSKAVTEIVQDASRFHELLMDESSTVTCKQINSEDLLVKSTPKKDFVDTDNKTNVVVALFTTMWARLKLYREVLDKLQERAYYTDTDSVIFKYDPNRWNPPTADYLGELTSELKPGHHIDEFTSGGPKNYTCKVVNSETLKHVTNITKVRGLKCT